MLYDPTKEYGELYDLSLAENYTYTVYYNFSELIKTLIIISYPANEQIQAIGFGAVADEMVLDFDNYYALQKDNYIKYGLINLEQKALLDDLNLLFEEYSAGNNPDFWDDYKLGQNPDWDIVRLKAKNIIEQIKMDHLILKLDRKQKVDKKGNILIESTKYTLIDKNIYKSI